MSELRQAIEAFKNQGKQQRAFLKVVDVLDEFDNLEVSCVKAGELYQEAADKLRGIQAEVFGAEITQTELKDRIAQLTVARDDAIRNAREEADKIVARANAAASATLEAARAEANASAEKIAEDKRAHAVTMAEYSEQQDEAQRHIATLKQEMAALKARLDL